MLIVSGIGEVVQKNVEINDTKIGLLTINPGQHLLKADRDGSLQPWNCGATMSDGRVGGRNDRRVRGGKQAANSRLEPGWTSRPDAGPSFRAASGVRMEKIKVLLFAANPRGTSPLDLPREFREIDDEVQRGPFRDAVELILVPGTRPVDLLRKAKREPTPGRPFQQSRQPGRDHSRVWRGRRRGFGPVQSKLTVGRRTGHEEGPAAR